MKNSLIFLLCTIIIYLIWTTSHTKELRPFGLVLDVAIIICVGLPWFLYILVLSYGKLTEMKEAGKKISISKFFDSLMKKFKELSIIEFLHINVKILNAILVFNLQIVSILNLWKTFF